MMDERNDHHVLLNVLAGIGLGALVGAAAALLFAPKPGEEIRGDLGHSIEDLKKKAEKMAGELVSKAEELVSKGKEVVDEAQGRIKEAVSAGREAVKQVSEEASEETPGA